MASPRLPSAVTGDTFLANAPSMLGKPRRPADDLPVGGSNFWHARLIRCGDNASARQPALPRLWLPRAALMASSFKSSVGMLADRLLTGWSLVRIRPGEPTKSGTSGGPIGPLNFPGHLSGHQRAQASVGARFCVRQHP